MLGCFVGAFAEMLQHQMSAAIDQICGRPIFVVEGLLRRVLIVLGDRVLDAVAADGKLHVARR
jgi:hypothetical protein